MPRSVFCFRPWLLAVAGLLCRSTLIYGYNVGTNFGAITIFASQDTKNVTRKLIVTNGDTQPLQIGLYHNYSLEGSHVFNLRHHIYPKSVKNDPANHQNLPSTSPNWEWTWANRTGFGGNNVPYWWILKNLPGLSRRRRLGAVDFSSLFEEVVQEGSMSDPRPRELSAVTIRVSDEAAAELPQKCSVKRASDFWTKAVSCEKADEASMQLGCWPTLTELSSEGYYQIQVPQECSSIQFRIWLEALSEELPIVEAHPNTHAEGVSRGVPDEAEMSSAMGTRSVAVRDAVADGTFNMTNNWKQTECYKQGSSAGKDMMDWSHQYDSNSVYFDKQAQKSFTDMPVAFVISAYATLWAMDPNFYSAAYLIDETEDTAADQDGDGVPGNRFGMYWDGNSNKLMGAGLWNKTGDPRTLGFYSAAFSRSESGFTLGAAPLMKYYACAAAKAGDPVAEAGILACLKWLTNNHRRLNVTMIINAYEIKVNWDLRRVFAGYSPQFPQFTVGQNQDIYDDPAAGRRELAMTTVQMPANFAMDQKDWGTLLACSERAGNNTSVAGGWAGAYSANGESCMYSGFSMGCVQVDRTTVSIGNRKSTALAWTVGQFALLQHYNKLANAYDYRILSYQKGADTKNSPAAYYAPGVSVILNRFDPANSHLKGLQHEFILKPGESREMNLTFTKENAASGVADGKGDFFLNRLGNIEVYASDVRDGLGPAYERTLRIPYRLDWGEEDNSLPRWYLGEE